MLMAESDFVPPQYFLFFRWFNDFTLCYLLARLNLGGWVVWVLTGISRQTP